MKDCLPITRNATAANLSKCPLPTDSSRLTPSTDAFLLIYSAVRDVIADYKAGDRISVGSGARVEFISADADSTKTH